MGLFDKGKELFEQNKDKIDEALHSEKAEGMSDQILDKAADGADNLTGGKYSDKIDGARDAADKKLGDE
ncbi:antitoxin [Paramicrobacterium agarici]|uniref:Antitoxin protein of toxin-antitoxin system n=1 Tax=Paramicrobacterium agarici TaxID=630514 RepID=A0A2A9E1T4_9MICO|nr:antitoxin [Microbacterium agarici]PFG32150.1 antitoxin protein of toxin-antitoxin system [Microbacterium agarici]TQO22043.1 antitoxin protein of toxin-antitoxin system [Microbacterium agarici]